MKSFDDFKASITQEDRNYICGVNDDVHTNLHISLDDPNALNEIIAFISAQNFKMNIRLLELYHEWLGQQD